MYNFKDIEKKWQDKWYNGDYFKAIDFHPTKPKYYILYEFYNISGNLHMGHLKGTVPADALARYKRFNGYNVLFPIGGDAFGLPAENAAIKRGINPECFVADGMEKAMEQSKAIGLSFDFDRTINTSSPDYYKWTQWIFLKLFENDKAYKANGVVNYCPTCKTVLSNEDSQGGICDRCHGKVIQENRSVWYLKMKEYSEKLLNNIDNINMNENLKELQRNWIGKSTGCEITFDIVDKNNNLITKKDIYTTCIETIYGITFMVLAPENDFIDKYSKYIENYNEVIEYRNVVAYRSEFDRISDQKEKTGCIIEGVYAINPVNNKKVCIYTSDFVLNNYGTGMVMAVPAHDERDYEFAKKYNIDIIKVIDGDIENKAYEKYAYIKNNSKMINSFEFTGMPVIDAKEKITNKLINMNICKIKTNYKMQDWSFNRQRYWGEPFPVVFCDKCGTVGVSEEQLPIILPKTNDYLPNEKGDSPLSKINSWINTTCPKCGASARRETDTMPNWAGSSWYWIRFIDPHNNNKLVDYEKAKYWGSVDCYTGGTEHITRHVLYAFFWQNFLYEIGVVPTRTPFIRKMGSGLILDDTGHKMSKSSTNGVSPMEVIEKYGTDVARCHVHFLGGYEDNTMWTYDGINGITNFLNNVWNLKDMIKDEKISEEHIYEINNLIKKVSSDIEDLKLNTSIAACMSFVKKIKEDKFITKEELRIFLILLNPIAPHITSEMYEQIFNGEITNETWPNYDENYLKKDIIKLPIQINGKMKKTIEVDRNISKENLISKIKKEYPNLIQYEDFEVIYICGKIINIVYNRKR